KRVVFLLESLHAWLALYCLALRVNDQYRSFPLEPCALSAVSQGRHSLARNPGAELDEAWVASVQVNRSAVERRVASLPGRRSVKNEAQAAWLLKAITCIDLTALSGDDTAGRIERLCHKARQPVRPDILNALGMQDAHITVGAV